MPLLSPLLCARRPAQVLVNGYEAAVIMLAPGARATLAAAGLPAAANNVTLRWAMEPALSGADAAATPRAVPYFVGFSAGGGGTFAPAVRAARRWDIIGDSISAGSMYDKLEAVNGDMSLGEGCHPWAPVTGYGDQSTWHSYLCRYFGVDCTAIAWSGRGLIQNSGCHAGPLLPVLYQQTFGTSAAPADAWDFSTVSRPDAVIVYLGTNDFSCNLTTDALFTATYVEFMHNITRWYAASPGGTEPIHFLATVGLMSPTRPVAAVRAAIAQATAEGLVATYLDMTNATKDGCGGHPGPIGHWQMALQAKPQIQAALGW